MSDFFDSRDALHNAGFTVVHQYISSYTLTVPIQGSNGSVTLYVTPGSQVLVSGQLSFGDVNHTVRTFDEALQYLEHLRQRVASLKGSALRRV